MDASTFSASLGWFQKSGYFCFFFEFFKLLVDVKDASSGKLFYPLDPGFVP
jgi:hypothetical protein